MIWRLNAACVLMIAVCLLASCGGNATSNGCTQSIGIDPVPATADHSAAPPGNQVTFTATLVNTGDRCPFIPTVIGDVDASWTTSDTANTTIVNQKTTIGTNGLATCLGATPAATPATITASTTGGLKSSTTLLCK
jgi:hypothetical protein